MKNVMRRLCKKRLASQFTTAEGRAELNANVCALLTDTNLRYYCLLYRRLQLQSMSIITIVALLVFLTIPEGSSLGDQPLLLRCQCITKEKKPIGRYIGQVEVIPASSHCNEIEIIATLKKNGQRICLDPNARWVRKVLKKKMVEQAP